MKNLNRTYKTAAILCGIAAILASCAKVSSDEAANVAGKRAFDAWMYVHYNDIFNNVGSIGHGIYIIGDEPGSGEYVQDSNYVFLKYECRKREDSSIVSYTSEEIAKQLGQYRKYYDFSPYIIRFCRNSLSQGLIDLLAGGESTGGANGRTPRTFGKMRIGGKRTAVIPGWLSSTTNYYDKETDYLNNVTGTDYIYSVEVTEQHKDIEQWQIDRIERNFKERGIPVPDTTGHRGLYYWRNKLREQVRGVTVREGYKFPDDTTIYIDYIGRLLDGSVFDTNIEDTAKVWGLYSESTSYTPMSINWNKDSTALTMTSDANTMIRGFALTLWQMHPYESGSGIFTSTYGYGSSGSGMSITSYSPLRFDIDIVDRPKTDE